MLVFVAVVTLVVAAIRWDPHLAARRRRRRLVRRPLEDVEAFERTLAEMRRWTGR